MQPQLQRVEVEAVWRGNHDFAIDDTSGRQLGEKLGVQLRKVAVERPRVPALNVNIVATTKHEGAKAIPLRLEQEVALGEVVGEFGEHRLDGWLDGISHVINRSGLAASLRVGLRLRRS